MDFDFAGKGALVAGAGGGMGLAIANGLLRAGADVTLADIKPRPAGIGPGRALYVEGDLSAEGFAAEAVGAAHDHAGRLDYLVNTIGVWWGERDGSCVDVKLEVWNRVLEINLTALMLTTRHAIPVLRRGGALVHFSSIQALRGDVGAQDAYGASKGAIRSFSKSIAIQFAHRGIRSNAILPGYIVTPMQQHLIDDPGRRAALETIVPLGRLGTPAEIAGACLFLLSDAASFITGTELIIDGGTTARP